MHIKYYFICVCIFIAFESTIRRVFALFFPLLFRLLAVFRFSQPVFLPASFSVLMSFVSFLNFYFIYLIFFSAAIRSLSCSISHFQYLLKTGMFTLRLSFFAFYTRYVEILFCIRCLCCCRFIARLSLVSEICIFFSVNFFCWCFFSLLSI